MTGSLPQLRPEVESLPRYVPGAATPSVSAADAIATAPPPEVAPVVPEATAAAQTGFLYVDNQRSITDRPDLHTVKLSSNENPYLPLPAVIEAIHQASWAINRYPDLQATALVSALAAKTGVTEDQIALGNGSVALLEHALAAILSHGDEVIYAWRSFEAYPICVAVAGGKSVQVPITAAGRYDLTAMAKAVTDNTKAVIICSPNNPTGPTVDKAEFEKFMSELPSHILVILDEAYVEYVRDPNAVNGKDYLEQYPNLISLRTLSKAYGLAGLRVGYALGNEQLISGIKATATPFGVNHLAQVAGVASLQPNAERVLSARIATIVAERTRVRTALTRQGWNVPEAQGNFIWLPVGKQAKIFADAAEKAGLLVRPFVDPQSDANSGVRVTVADGDANNQFLRFAASWAIAHGLAPKDIARAGGQSRSAQH
ncbi:MAG: histidinol-phosphate transaminase [Promicromonosporaceae bacterium]|nr:histidinol-phosphate transaminase [Promicromonosporaceae bacterium]